MKNDSRERVLKIVGRIAVKGVQRDVGKNRYWWPPVCAGFLHQPKRPVKK